MNFFFGLSPTFLLLIQNKEKTSPSSTNAQCIEKFLWFEDLIVQIPRHRRCSQFDQSSRSPIQERDQVEDGSC